MYKKIILTASFSLLIDQIIKYAVCILLPNQRVIPNFLSLVYAENDGVAFSMLSGNRFLIILISILLLGVVIYLLSKEKLNDLNKNTLLVLSYGFLIGGILGNLTDRIIKGVVIDYVSLKIFGHYFPVFNLADLFITTGVILIVIKTIKEDKKHS